MVLGSGVVVDVFSEDEFILESGGFDFIGLGFL